MERCQIIRRIMVFALVGIVLVSCFTTTIAQAATLTSGKSGTSKIVLYGKGKDGKYYYSPHSGNRQLKFTVRVSGKDYEGYCIQIGKKFDYSGQKYTVKNYKDAAAYKALSSAKQRLLALILTYGYNEGKSAPYGNITDYRAATQTLVWETVSGEIALSASGAWSRKASKQYKLIKGHSYAEKNYDWMKAKIQSHVKGASFTAMDASGAKPYTMHYHYGTKRWVMTLNDTNKFGTYELLGNSTAGLSLSRNGNQYTFSADKAGTYTANLRNEIKTGTSQGMIVLQPSKAANQALALGATDETKFYVKFNTEAESTLKLVKTTDEGGTVQGFAFEITGTDNGYSGTFTTDEQGIISAKLYPGTYRIEEKLTEQQMEEGYQAEDAKAVQLTSDGADVKFHNQYKPTKGKLEIRKQTDDDGPVEGIPFQIKGILFDSRTLSAEQVVKHAAPELKMQGVAVDSWDVNEADLKKLNDAAKAGKTGTFKVALSAKLKNQGEKPTVFSDVPKKVEERTELTTTAALSEQEQFQTAVTITVKPAKDAEEEAACSRAEEKAGGSELITCYDFTWAGAASTYETQVKTGKDGIFLSEKMEYGQYTVTEQMNETLSTRYHPVESKHIVLDREHRNGTVAFTNQAKTGSVKIRKSCIDGKIANIEMTITGTTAYGEKIKPIVCMTDEKGVIAVERIPAGTYTITESNLDESIYLPVEPKQITITGDEKEVIDVAFENIPYSGVEISKKSATTGEELPGASLQVRDDKSGKIVDRWISTDQPHLIKNLIYGNVYILHEEICPKGYRIANDIKFIAGSDQKVEMVDEITETVFSKTDMTTGEELPGATIQVIKKDTNELVEEWVSTDQPHMIEGLEVGQRYVMREITAPDGYELAEEITFVAGQQDKVEMKDKPTVTVIETGDRINRVLVAFCIATLALIGALALVIFRKVQDNH